MYIKWDESLSVGIQEIDDQHKELFDRINHLLRTIGELHAQGELKKTLDFMEEYALLHFGLEEEQMILANYGGYGEHKGQHDHMREEIEELRNRLVNEGPNEKLLVYAQELLVDWLQRHIRSIDMKMARHFQSL
jgi:hemerythrin